MSNLQSVREYIDKLAATEQRKINAGKTREEQGYDKRHLVEKRLDVLDLTWREREGVMTYFYQKMDDLKYGY